MCFVCMHDAPSIYLCYDVLTLTLNNRFLIAEHLLCVSVCTCLPKKE